MTEVAGARATREQLAMIQTRYAEAARLDASTVSPRFRGGRRGRLHTPRRVEVIERLRD